MKQDREIQPDFSAPDELLFPLIDTKNDLVVDDGTDSRNLKVESLMTPPITDQDLENAPDAIQSNSRNSGGLIFEGYDSFEFVALEKPKTGPNPGGKEVDKTRKTPWTHERELIKQRKRGLLNHSKAVFHELLPLESTKHIEVSADRAPISSLVFGSRAIEPEGSTVVFDTLQTELGALKTGQSVDGLRVKDLESMEDEPEEKLIVVDQFRTSDDKEVTITISPSDIKNSMSPEEAKFKINDPAFRKAASLRAPEERFD